MENPPLEGKVASSLANDIGSNGASQVAKQALSRLRDWSQSILRPVGSAVGAVTGQTALDEVTSYIQENEAINTALATRVYDLLERESVTSKRMAETERPNVRLRCFPRSSG